LSVRTINRAFNATGQTVGETIRIRRLARARNELAELRQPVGTIATKWVSPTAATSAAPSKPVTPRHRRSSATPASGLNKLARRCNKLARVFKL